jgi:hypothetical protein
LKFDTDHLTAPAGTAFKIVFDNQDPDQHNVAIHNGSTPLFTGEIFGGPKTMTYAVPALPAGTYTFQCDVHPFMNGTFTVAAGSAPTSGATSAATSRGTTAPTTASTSGAATTAATSGPSGTTATSGTTGG